MKVKNILSVIFALKDMDQMIHPGDIVELSKKDRQNPYIKDAIKKQWLQIVKEPKKKKIKKPKLSNSACRIKALEI